MNLPMARRSGNVLPDADPSQKTIGQLGREMGFDPNVVAAALQRLAENHLLSTAPDALPADEATFLEAHGGVTPNPQALIEARIANAINEENEHNDSVTVREAADLLGVSESRVRHRLSDGTLYAYKSNGRGVERKLPRWQFHGTEVIPHLGVVLSALPDWFTPLDSKAFFLNARVDHPTNGETYSVKEWLLGGEDPDEVIALADEQKYTI